VAFSISFGEIIEIISNRNRFKKEQMASYLDLIAKEARTLAEIWRHVLQESNDKLQSKEDREQRQQLNYDIDQMYGVSPNLYSNFRLQEFYNQLSNVIGG